MKVDMSMPDDPQGQSNASEPNEIGPVSVSEYRTFLNEPYRPPSKGGNTRALHQHSFLIEGQRYSFLALGAKKWVFKNDTVQFSWQWDDSRKYRNVISESIKTYDYKGDAVVRGERGTKKKRTAPARMPASRREQRD